MVTATSADDPAPMDLPPRSGTYRFGSMMNPPHLGHLAVVDAVHEQLGLHRIEIVPAGIPPHRGAPRVPARTRLELAIRAFADIDYAVVSDTEVERGEHGEVGYMVDTIEEAVELPEVLGFDDLVVAPTLVVGADQMLHLQQWHRWERITDLARIAVVTRPDHASDASIRRHVADLARTGVRIDVVDMRSVAISSTLVRDVAGRGDVELLRRLVPLSIVSQVLDAYRE